MSSVTDARTLLLLADVVLALHAALAAFLTLGLAAILIGWPEWRLGGWRWVRNRKFRIAHLAGLGVVAAESVLGIVCPLTDWENALRAAAGMAGSGGYRGGFIAHWLGALLFYDFDERVFAAAYLAALGLALWAWRRWGPLGGRAGGATPAATRESPRRSRP